MTYPDVVADIAIDAGTEIASIKIQDSQYELNIFLTVDDIDIITVKDLPNAPDERAICAGESCGASAHWSRCETGMLICIGHDDTTWDFGVQLPYTMFSTIKSLLRPLRERLSAQNGG